MSKEQGTLDKEVNQEEVVLVDDIKETAPEIVQDTNFELTARYFQSVGITISPTMVQAVVELHALSVEKGKTLTFGDVEALMDKIAPVPAQPAPQQRPPVMGKV